nr:MAG TPA: hypothetical protein [Caudoviricetes sp.]
MWFLHSQVQVLHALRLPLRYYTPSGWPKKRVMLIWVVVSERWLEQMKSVPNRSR